MLAEEQRLRCQTLYWFLLAVGLSHVAHGSSMTSDPMTYGSAMAPDPMTHGSSLSPSALNPHLSCLCLSLAGAIQLSAATRVLLTGGEDVLHATSVDVKGKGVMSTYIYHPSPMEAPSQLGQGQGAAAGSDLDPSIDSNSNPDPGRISASALSHMHSSGRAQLSGVCSESGGGGASSSRAQDPERGPGGSRSAPRSTLGAAPPAPRSSSKPGIQELLGRITNASRALRTLSSVRPAHKPAVPERTLQAPNGWLGLSEVVFGNCPEEILSFANHTC